MDMDEYQVSAFRFANKELDGKMLLLNSVMGMNGEAGEAIDHVKKHLCHGHELDQAAFLKEVGDVLWYVALACTVMGVDMSAVAQANIAKLTARYPEGHFSTERSVHRAE